MTDGKQWIHTARHHQRDTAIRLPPDKEVTNAILRRMASDIKYKGVSLCMMQLLSTLAKPVVNLVNVCYIYGIW